MKKRDAVFAVSLATLLFLESWDQIQGLPARSFYVREFVTRGDMLRALIPNIVLAAAAIFAALRSVRGATRVWVQRMGEAIPLLLFYIPLRQIVVWVAPPEWTWRILHALGLVLIVVVAATATLWVRLPFRVMTALIMGASPLLPFLLFYFWIQPHPSREAARIAPLLF